MKFLLFQNMKVISVFEPIKKMKYFSPDHYFNRGSSFTIRPREKALLVFTSKWHSVTTNQYQIKFTKSHCYLKYPCYKFIICVQNTSRHRKIICNTNCLLSTLLQHRYIHHYYLNIALTDLHQARRFSI
jgi:hypothetical protein